jgi:Potato inhibitor I family
MASEGKRSWPELAGSDAQEAIKTIKSENKVVTNTPILAKGSPVTKDLRFNRVRIFVEDDGKTVASTPRIC